ncbi:DUF6574 domain-containing protein [Streptococcus dentiloxodontae]
MTKEDWLDFFEAINGRSATDEEIAAALAAGEFEETSAQPNVNFQQPFDPAADSAQSQTFAQATPEQAQMNFQQSTASSQPTQGQTVFGQQAPNQQATQAQFQQQGAPVQQPQFQQGQAGSGFQQQGIPGQQPQFNGPAVPKQPSAFTSAVKGFWDWLFNAWKKPATVFSDSASNGFISFGLHVFILTVFLFTLLYKTVSNYIGYASYGGYNTAGLGFSAFFFILLSAIILIFAYVLAGFTARKAIYRDADTTFINSFEKFGRLTALNLPIMLLGFLVSLVGLTGFGNFLLSISLAVYGLANIFITFPLDSKATWDKFYQYIVSFLINAVIVGIAFYIIVTILSNYIQGIFTSF